MRIFDSEISNLVSRAALCLALGEVRVAYSGQAALRNNCEIEVSLEPPRPGDPSRWLVMLGRRKQSWVGARNTLNSKQSSELRGSGIKRIRKITRSGLPVVMNKGSNPTIVNLLDRTHSLVS